MRSASGRYCSSTQTTGQRLGTAEPSANGWHALPSQPSLPPPPRPKLQRSALPSLPSLPLPPRQKFQPSFPAGPMAPAKDQLLAANCAACAGWYVEEAGGQVHTTIAIYSWRTRATPAARAMAEESQHEMPEGTLIESPSRHDAEPREEPVLLGGPEAGSPWCRNPWTPREPAAASASVPVKAWAGLG